MKTFLSSLLFSVACWCTLAATVLAANPAPAATLLSPKERYARIKKTVHETFETSDLRQIVLREVKSGLQQKVVDLDLCWNAEHLGVRESSPIQTAITIALFSEGVEYELSLCNLPRAAAANTFAAMEALALKSLQDRQLSGSAVKQQGEQVYQLAKRFPDEVNAYAKTKSGAPHFIWLGECGGLGPPVTIKTKPPGATVSYISLFSYKLCEALHVNAEDTDKCDGWVTALAVTEDLVGKYRYLAVWPDGKQRRGAFSVNNKTTLTISQ